MSGGRQQVGILGNINGNAILCVCVCFCLPCLNPIGTFFTVGFYGAAVEAASLALSTSTPPTHTLGWRSLQSPVKGPEGWGRDLRSLCGWLVRLLSTRRRPRRAGREGRQAMVACRLPRRNGYSGFCCHGNCTAVPDAANFEVHPGWNGLKITRKGWGEEEEKAECRLLRWIHGGGGWRLLPACLLGASQGGGGRTTAGESKGGWGKGGERLGQVREAAGCHWGLRTRMQEEPPSCLFFSQRMSWLCSPWLGLAGERGQC